MVRSGITHLALLVLSAAWLATVHADAPPAAPTPGQVQSTLPTTPALPKPKASTPVTPPAAESPAIIPPGGETVTLQRFDISGNTVFSSDVLRAEIASYLNKPLTLAEIYKVADVLTNYYQSRGYSIARATIPQQKLDNGALRIEIIEGRIGKVMVEGNTRTRSDVVLSQSRAIVPGEPYTDKAMDRAVSLVNDLPGLQAQAVLQPGSEFGTADVVYKATEQSYDGEISTDDYGRKSTGRIRFNASVDINSPTGSGDRLSAAVTHAEHNLLNFGSLLYSLPLGPDGGRLAAGYNESDYRVSDPQFYRFNIHGRTENGSLNYQFAGERSHDENFYWGLGWLHSGGINRFEIPATQKTPLTKSGTDSNLNTFQVTFLYNRYNQNGASTTVTGSFTTNGKQDRDGLHTNAEAARINLDGTWYRPIGDGWSFLGRTGGQWSADTLPDTDKYSLGGPDNVRGFESAEERGDSGVFASGEVQHSLGSWPASLGWFVDGGKVWTQGVFVNELLSTASGTTNQTIGSNATLTATGLDLQFISPGRRWHGSLQWAYAIGGRKPSDGNEGGHVWASIAMSF